MGKYQLKSCLRCDEFVHSEQGSLYRCQDCGFLERNTLGHVDSVEALQKQEDRTLDLVEIFHLISMKKEITSL